MAGDWIKMRVDLADDPAVIGIAARLGLDEFAVVGRLQALWSWADGQSRDGHAAGVTAQWINRKLQRDGFAEAMAAVGWLVIDDTGITLPNFDNHNGASAKTRALGKNRKQKERSSSNGHESVAPESRKERDTCVTREEKRREEETPHSPPEGGAPSGKSSKRAEQIGLTAFLAACHEQGESAIPEDDAVFAYADSIGLPREFVALAWAWFKRKWAKKRQAGVRGWRQTFRNAVQDNWPKYWFVDGDGVWQLTTAGKQAQMAAEAGEGA